ncbi:MAG: hypothetical protein JF611_02380 [Betaproteobacteria bacterium]|nr:hypothetical protein [Betaproteobacteria bacterium]
MVRALTTLVLALLVSGCSTVRLVYDNADVYLGWRANHYLNLDDAMSEEMDERIASFMAWHRAQALPKYAQLADDARRRLERGLQPADLVWGYDSGVAQAREGLRQAAERIAPLLDRLSAQQIAHLERRLGDDNRRFARENLRGSERDRTRRRTERNVERLEDWVGRLSRAQVERVAQYSQRAPAMDELRERDHKRLQAELLALLRAKEAQKRLPDFLANFDRGREPAYAAAVEASRREYVALVLDLDRSLSREQRARAARELGRYADEFRALARAAR